MRRLLQRPLILALAFTAATSSVAVAQTQTAQTPNRSRDRSFEASETIATDLRNARLHSGPFYLLSSIQLSDLGYEEQYFAPTSDQTSGFTFGVQAPQKLYFVPSRKTIYSVAYTPEYGFFSKSRGRNEYGYAGRADAHFILNHNYWNVYGVSADHLQAESGEINRVVTVREKAAGLNGELRYSSRTRLIYSAAVKRYAFPLTRIQPTDLNLNLPQLDHVEHDYRAMFRHQTFPLTALTLASEWNGYTFRTAPQKNSDRRYVAPGFIWDNGRATLRAEAGPAQLHFKEPGQKDFKGVIGNGTFTQRLGARGNLTLAAGRDTFFSIYSTNNFYIADRAGLTLEHETSRHFSLHFVSTFGRDTYDIRTLSPAGDLVFRRDDIEWTAVGWRYTTRHFKGGFDVGYYDRRSNVNIDEQNGIRLAVQLSLSP